MTEAAAQGSDAKSGIPPAANGSGAALNGSGSNGAGDPFTGLETGIPEWVGKHGIKDVSPESFGKVAKIAMSAESLIGKSVQLPGDDAKPEDWSKFYGRVGRPEKADSYEFALPEGLPKDLPYDADFALKFKPAAYDAGLTAKQAAKVHDFYVKEAADYFGKQREANSQRVVAATDAFEKEWGKKDSEPFKAAVEDMTRAVKGLELSDALQGAGLLGSIDGKQFIVDAAVGKALAKVGKTMFREDSMVNGSGGGSAPDNPFKDGPNKGNMTEQNLLWNNDRAKATAMIRQAGHTPEAFGYRS